MSESNTAENSSKQLPNGRREPFPISFVVVMVLVIATLCAGLGMSPDRDVMFVFRAIAWVIDAAFYLMRLL